MPARFLLTTVSLLIFATTAHAAPILDQDHSAPGNFPALAVAEDRTQVQTFTVGMSGLLTTIEVEIAVGSQTFEDLLLSVWTTDATGGLLQMLAMSSVPPSAIPPPIEGMFGFGFAVFDLSLESILVSPGDALAIALNSNAANTAPFDERYNWVLGGQYDGGRAYTLLGQQRLEQIDDLHFRSFVTPVSAPEPGLMSLLGSALIAAQVRSVRKSRQSRRRPSSAKAGCVRAAPMA
jgi:hypothetical protein